jgi:hypothetical protein
MPHTLIFTSTENDFTLCLSFTLGFQQWRGSFSKKAIHDLTTKANNVKQFDKFLLMLNSALDKKSQAVFYNILTPDQLQMLKTEQLKSSGNESRFTPASFKNVQGKGLKGLTNNRYFILSYDVDFEQVHYPLILQYAESTDANQLRQAIALLHKQLGPSLGENFSKDGQSVCLTNEQSAKELELQRTIVKLQEEKKHIIETQRDEIHLMGQQIDQLQQEKVEYEERIGELERIVDDLDSQMHMSHSKPNSNEIANLKRQINSLKEKESRALAREQELTHELKLASNKIKDLMNQSRVNTYTRYATESVKSKKSVSVKSRPTSLNRSERSFDSKGFTGKNFINSKIPPKKIMSSIPKPSPIPPGSRKYTLPPVKSIIGRKASVNRSRSISPRSNGSNYLATKKDRSHSKSSFTDATKRNELSKNRVASNYQRNIPGYGRKPSHQRDQSSVDLNNSQNDSFEDRKKRFDMKKGGVNNLGKPNTLTSKKSSTQIQNKRVDDNHARIEAMNKRLTKLRQESYELNQ